MTRSAISIVVPVYNAAEDAGRCFEALNRTVSADQSVIVIDDGSTDPQIDRMLYGLPPSWRMIRHIDNQGFVATANHGFRLAGRDDVLLLNSDTAPGGDWLERITACAASDSRIASITPFSNNGEIVSLPELCRSAPMPEDPEQWALACLRAGPPTYPELPTAVGFCMYLRRACLDAIGGFDESTFGLGYGEENDWCMRATTAGWRHVLCDDAFVAHRGGASFGPIGLKSGGEAMERLLERHPDYEDRVRDFIRTDPLAQRRAAVLAALEDIRGLGAGA